jgi:hypothetical protein
MYPKANLKMLALKVFFVFLFLVILVYKFYILTQNFIFFYIFQFLNLREKRDLLKNMAGKKKLSVVYFSAATKINLDVIRSI